MGKQATIETSKGTLVVELFPGEAPKTVANFEQLANDGFYDGIRFHRVIPDFVVQGGCPHTKTGAGPVGTGGPGWRIPCETKGNPHTHEVGALSMAHAGKDTGGSQFFLVPVRPCKRVSRMCMCVHSLCAQLHQGCLVLETLCASAARV